MNAIRLLKTILPILLFGFSSCQNDSMSPFQDCDQPFEIVTGAKYATRTVLIDGQTVAWENGDAIAVYDYVSPKREFTAVVEDGTTRFKGNITSQQGSFLAVYPYALAEDDLVSQNVVMSVPTSQIAVAGGFAPNTNLSITKGERNIDGSPSQVVFRNLCQLLKLHIPSYIDNRITSIVLSGTQNIAGKVSVNYSSEAPVVTFQEQGGVNQITLLPPSGNTTFAQGTYYIAMAPVALNGFTLTFTDNNGKVYSQQSNSTIGGERGKVYTLGSMDLIDVPTISSKHVYANGELQGTDVTLSAPVSDKDWSAVIKNSQGVTVRSLSSATGTLKSEYTDASWPYLPKGSYSVEYTYRTANGADKSATTTFNIIENPSFGVTQTAASTYSYYVGDGVEKNVKRANTLDAYTVTDIYTSVTGISNKILQNPNYKVTYSNEFNGSPTAASNAMVSYADCKYETMGSYTFSATATFDGITKSVNKKIHITGLPYSATPPTDAEWDGNVNNWSFNKWGHYGVRLHKHTISKSFSVPGNVDINITQDVDVHTCTVGSTYTLSAGGAEVYKAEESGRTAGNECHNHDGTHPGTLTVSNSTVSLDNSYGNPGTSGLFYGTHLLVRKIVIQYR